MKKQRLYVSHGRYITAERVVSGIPINPVLPERFDCTANDFRPPSHQKFWGVPYIVTDTIQEHDDYTRNRTDGYGDAARERWFGAGSGREQWLQSWPSGVRYDVRCLDSGAWDRSTWKGSFADLDAAVEFAVAITAR